MIPHVVFSRVVLFATLSLPCIWWASPTSGADPAPPTIKPVLAGEVVVKNIFIYGGAVISETSVVVVGSTEMDDEKPKALDEYGPNGAIVDLAKKSSRRFVNDHTGRINSVCVSNGRILTGGGSKADPNVRVWDVAADKTAGEIELVKPGEGRTCDVVSFHKSKRVAIACKNRVVVFDPAKPDEKTYFATPPEVRHLLGTPVVSPDDDWIACDTSRDQVVVWNVKTQDSTVAALFPGQPKVEEWWSVSTLAFGPKGELFACRSADTEVPLGKPEKDVPADKRSLARIELPGGRVVPLGIGHTVYTMSCSIDPTGTWLATGGTSWLHKPLASGQESGGELRVYHLPTKTLAFRQQFEHLSLTWVSFTPSGNRIVAATADGRVMWWDVKPK